MTVPSRIDLTPASGLPSSYNGVDISNFNNVGQRGNYITPDMFEALKKLEELVRLNSGQLLITDLFRTWETQLENREKFESGSKSAFVQRPGHSFHNSGRAVDFSVKELSFGGLDRSEWLEFFWELCKPLGFKPVISLPDIDASEAWHFDFPGDDWSDAYDRIKYKEVAKCSVLDVGQWNPDEDKYKVRKMFVQSQCIRLGYYSVGSVDGIYGPKTNKVLKFLGVEEFDVLTQANMLAKRDKV